VSDEPLLRSRRAWWIVNDFIHDMSTGLWAASLLVIWVLSRRAASASAEVAEALRAAEQAVFWLLVAALIGLAVTGAVRLAYWRRATPPAALAEKRALLAAKHVAFFVVYGLGTVWAYWMAWR
jgi:hypothetical protein